MEGIFPTPTPQEMEAWQKELEHREARDRRRADERIARFQRLFCASLR